MLKEVILLAAIAGVALAVFESAPIVEPNESVDQEIESRIVGGTNVTDPAHFNFVVSIRNNATIPVHICGGAILTNRWILTSARCVLNRVPDGIRAFIGSNNVQLATMQMINMIAINPGFNATTLVNDLAMIRTTFILPISATVQTIPFHNTDPLIGNNITLFVHGYGMTDRYGGPISLILQRLQKLSMPQANCVGMFADTNNAAYVQPSKLCTWPLENQGVCNGDFGSPLIEETGVAPAPITRRVVGVVSWSIQCARGYPDVYERTLPHAGWIAATLLILA